MKCDGVAESGAAYVAEIDYDNDHRYAEHEHESRAKKRQGDGMRWSAVGEFRRGIIVNCRRPLIPIVRQFNSN